MEKRRLIPVIITLLGCLAACIVAVRSHYDAMRAMKVILTVLVVFYIAGLLIKGLADKYLVIEKIEENEEEQQENAENQDAEKENGETVGKKDSALLTERQNN